MTNATNFIDREHEPSPSVPPVLADPGEAPLSWPALPPTPPPASRAPRRRRAALGVAGIVALSMTAGAIGGRLTADDAAPASSVAVDAVSIGGGGASVAQIVDAVEESVVSIETTVSVRRGPFSGEASGAGTGIVLDGGYILTNAHVIEGATEVTVTASDGSTRQAEVIGSDTSSDVAVLHVDDTAGLVPASIDTAAVAAVGDDVVAIGNALALEGGLTVTKGIVSALDRSIDTENGTISDLIQTDAAISSGNSGGPLVNGSGQVIGMNTAVATSSGTVSASNIGFSIDIGTALTVAERLIGTTA
ncbi:MAG: S1C family serine protease [Acidimicrobiia bacterium]